MDLYNNDSWPSPPNEDFSDDGMPIDPMDSMVEIPEKSSFGGDGHESLLYKSIIYIQFFFFESLIYHLINFSKKFIFEITSTLKINSFFLGKYFLLFISDNSFSTHSYVNSKIYLQQSSISTENYMELDATQKIY